MLFGSTILRPVVKLSAMISANSAKRSPAISHGRKYPAVLPFITPLSMSSFKSSACCLKKPVAVSVVFDGLSKKTSASGGI